MMLSPANAPLGRIFLLLAFFSTVNVARSSAMLLVKSSKNKCVSVTAPMGTKLAVEYHAPDIFADGRHPTDSPTLLTISIKVMESGDAQWKSQIKNRLQMSKVAPQSHRLDTPRGTVEYDVPANGDVSVCIRAAGASTKRPMRFGLRIDKRDEMEAHEDKGEARDAVDNHLTHMEMEMRHLKLSMKNIIAEADFSKERETNFHHQTLSMHSASMWWPIVQLCVLLLTGFTQANHVVRFLKTKRLI
uniref:GOLD domain-containing protein n=1 Tax=Cyclophora tenuis TaxID=216820 RepID=A0A7S1D5G2_CYCTE|mmetsp:Transcript_22512/g.38285  ORF Transcript_22512/g.38285 Transcript_22512/m.38285 type:complete len:245 (+) Transcript_22512:3-737(+)